MRIKKFEAGTETAAMELAKGELGPDAIVLNIKTVTPRGIKKFFFKPTVELTAAYDERAAQSPAKTAVRAAAPPPAEISAEKTAEDAPSTKEEFFGSELTSIMKEITISEQQVKIKDLEKQLESKEENLAKVSRLLAKSAEKKGNAKYGAPVVRMFDDVLSENGVMPEIRGYILDEIDELTDIDDIDINLIVKIVYNTIVSILGPSDPPEPVRVDKKMSKTAVYAFIGSTGVGKTTTIAKIAANYMLEKGLNVGLVTADTYRMAAVEQLKLYGEIFGVDVQVIYNPSELPDCLDKLAGINDVVLVDTAGRSPKSGAALEDMKKLLAAMPPEKEIFLVLSLTTKSEDLLKIVETYEDVAGGDFRLIFTKWDETTTIGSVLNVVYKTGRKVAYITTGQSVPQDFEVLKPEKAARAIMGL